MVIGRTHIDTKDLRQLGLREPRVIVVESDLDKRWPGSLQSTGLAKLRPYAAQLWPQYCVWRNPA